MTVSIDRTAVANELAELAERLEDLADEQLDRMPTRSRLSAPMRATVLHASRQLRTIERVTRDEQLEPDLEVIVAYTHAASLTLDRAMSLEVGR